jgi:hypothetical protein
MLKKHGNLKAFKLDSSDGAGGRREIRSSDYSRSSGSSSLASAASFLSGQGILDGRWKSLAINFWKISGLLILG